MNEAETTRIMLEGYAKASTPVSQQFYQGLCTKAAETIKQLQAKLDKAEQENKRLSDVCVKHGFTISELHTRIDKMTINDIDPETRLSGYKWLTNSLVKRRNELREQLDTANEENKRLREELKRKEIAHHHY